MVNRKASQKAKDGSQQVSVAVLHNGKKCVVICDLSWVLSSRDSFSSRDSSYRVLFSQKGTAFICSHRVKQNIVFIKLY